MTWVALTEGTLALAADANSNFQHVGIGSLLPLGNSGTMAATSGVYDVGSSSYNWRTTYVNNLYATNQTLYVSGGSIKIDGTLTADTLAISATVVYVGSVYWSSAASTSGYSFYTGTAKYMKFFQTSTLQPNATLTIAHGIASGRTAIKQVWGVADAYDAGNYLQTFSGNQSNDTSSNLYKAMGSFSWDDTNVYVNRFVFDEAYTVTAFVFVEYVP